jgi:hypothetical protein
MAENFEQDDKVLEGDQDEQDSSVEKDPYQDVQAISARIDRALSIDRFQRSLFEREWFRNVLFLAGQQWVIYERGRWRPRSLPAWFPRAQTNKFAEKYNDIVAQLVQGHRIPIVYQPATGDEKDQATAQVGDRLREVIYTETEVDEKETDLAGWLIATGNAFLLPHYDMDNQYGSSFVQFQECKRCQSILKPEDLAETEGSCPICAEQGDFHQDLQPAVDENGNKIGDEYPIGAIQADVCSPFEIRIDHRITSMKQQRRFVRQRRYDLDFAKEKWSEFEKVIQSDWGNDLSQYYLDVLAHVTSSFSASGGFIGGGPAAPKNPKVTAYEFYELPSKKFPQGLRAVRLGANSQAVVEAGPLPSKYGAGVRKGQYFLPLIHFGFDKLPGRFWRKTRLDDLVPLQIFRNTVEANLRLSAQRMGNAIWLKPKGSGVSIITGEPGQEIEYNPISLGGQSFAKPERVPAELNNVQPLIMLISKIDDAMERVAGTFFLQGGDTPPGVTAASALAYLGERAQKSMSPLMSEYAKGWRQFEYMTLEIARENWDEQRVRVIAGKNRKWQVSKFSKADLQGAVNLIIDYNGMFPKSNATERATIAQLVQMGIINPAADEETRFNILKAFGEMALLGSKNTDVEDAAKEQDAFLEDATFIPRIRPMVDNSKIHLMMHTEFAKTDEFRELPEERQQIWLEHIANTVTDIVARQMALQGMGLADNPDDAELASGQAQIGAQAGAQANAGPGGAPPDGSEGPDPRLGAPAMTPDIASGATPNTIKPAGSPDAIHIPGGPAAMAGGSLAQ